MAKLLDDSRVRQEAVRLREVGDVLGLENKGGKLG
jgi:hypothetical protein